MLAPEGPPRDVDITVVSSTSLTVSWLIPEEEDHNGVISGYLVEIGETDTGLVIADVAVAGTELDHTFNVLTPYQEYFARVAARTSAGQGPFSDQEVARLPADSECTHVFALSCSMVLFALSCSMVLFALSCSMVLFALSCSMVLFTVLFTIHRWLLINLSHVLSFLKGNIFYMLF